MTIIIMVFSIIIIFTCAFLKSLKEGLTNNEHIVLIGDSVLNNSIYVPFGKSVFDILKTKTPNIFNFAEDGAKINDCYSQIDKIPAELNKTGTYIFISVGGNDILNKNENLEGPLIKQLFNNNSFGYRLRSSVAHRRLRLRLAPYMELIKSARTKFEGAKINVLNLYLPTNPHYQSYKQTVIQWNALINEYSSKADEMYNVINLYTLLTTPSDFIYDIEPSESASQKIANVIYLT